MIRFFSLIVVTLGVLATFNVALDETSCDVVERKHFVDIGFSRNRKPGDYDIYVNCNFNGRSVITSLETKFSNPKNESVTEINGHDIPGLEYLPVDVVDVFPNIQKISIYRTSLKAITKANFRGLRKLRFVDISYNQISTIDEDAFADQVDIYRIHLDDNKLTSLPSKIFSKLSTLDTLHLNKNQLTSLDADIFKNNVNLALLFLEENKFTTFASGTFDSLTKMRQIWFHKNDISALNSYWFKNCISLSDVLVSDNKITEIPLDFLATLQALRQISFSHNPLSLLDFAIFEKNTKINDVSFNGIKFEKILNIDVVDKLNNLQGIHLEINDESCVIGSFHEGTIEKLKQEVKANCKTK